MRRRSRGLGLAVAAVWLMMLTSSAEAESEAAARRARFNQILAVMDRNGDRVIDEGELEAFLRTKSDTILSRLRSVGLIVTERDNRAFEEFIHRQAVLIINRIGDGTGIRERDLKAFEDAKLEYPFVGTIKDLLPPPVGSVVGPERATSKEPEDIIDTLQNWISIRKSFLDSKDVGRPASLSVTHFADDDKTRKMDRPQTVRQVRGALALTHPSLDFNHALGDFTLSWNPVVVAEVDVSSDAKAERDKVVHRIGFQGTLFRTEPTEWWSGHNVVLTFDYTTDKDYDSALLGGTGQYSPNFGLVGIGEYKQVGEFPLYLRWRPYVGATYAEVKDAGRKEKLKEFENYINPFVRVAVELLAGSRLHVTPELTFHYELKNSERGHFLFGLGVRYAFDEKDRVSIEASYTRGEDSPEFINQNILQVALGVKF